MFETYKNNKNFLGSEVGLERKTFTVPASTSFVTENNRKIVKAGTYFATPYKGLLFEDVDITDGANEGSLVIRGEYIDANLPTSVSSHATDLTAQGLYAIVPGTTTRPDYGTVGLTALSAPVTSVSTATVSWSAITGAVGYNIYNANKVLIDHKTTTSYTATATGTYYVQAQGDNINKVSSTLASATVSSLT